MYKRNSTAQWLRGLPAADRNTIINECSRNKVVRQKVKAGQDLNKTIADAQKQRQDEIDQISAEKAAQTEQHLALPSGLTEMWSADNFQEKLEVLYPQSHNKWNSHRQELMRAVCKHIHAVVTHKQVFSINWPSRGTKNYHNQVTQMQSILGNANIMKCYRQAMARNATANNNGQDELDAQACMLAAQDVYVAPGSDVFLGSTVRLQDIAQGARTHRSSKRKREDQLWADESAHS